MSQPLEPVEHFGASAPSTAGGSRRIARWIARGWPVRWIVDALRRQCHSGIEAHWATSETLRD